MSLILEALKKSEAERRLGRAPDLLSPVPREAAGRPTWLGGFALGLGLALVTIGLAAWWLAGRTPDAVPAAPAPVVAETGAPVVAPQAAPPPVRAQARRQTPEARARRAPDPALAPAPALRDPEYAARERESVALPAGSEPYDGAATAGAPRSASQPAAPTLPDAAPTRVPVAPVAPVSVPAPAPVAMPEPLEAVPHLAWLTAAEREGLPPLRLSMHVYDPDPAARFVLIDGHRLREGDAVADGVVVDSIRPDGVALERRGRRFLLPRP